MKKLMSLVAICVVLCLTMTGADFFSRGSVGMELRRHCGGYTVIENGKGLDCHGDTIKLVKKNGHYELAMSRTNTGRL
jgi:hypothetical protein